MNKIDCRVVQDLLVLYIDDLVSEESKKILEEHLEKCEECKMYLNLISQDEKIEVKIDNIVEKKGEKIVKQIKKSQDRLKYTLIIFSMFVAVSNGWISDGFLKTIPFIIIIPCILRLFFKESKIIIITAICSNIALGIATGNFEIGLISTPGLIISVLSGIFLGNTIMNLREENCYGKK